MHSLTVTFTSKKKLNTKKNAVMTVMSSTSRYASHDHGNAAVVTSLVVTHMLYTFTHFL